MKICLTLNPLESFAFYLLYWMGYGLYHFYKSYKLRKDESDKYNELPRLKTRTWDPPPKAAKPDVAQDIKVAKTLADTPNVFNGARRVQRIILNAPKCVLGKDVDACIHASEDIVEATKPMIDWFLKFAVDDDSVWSEFSPLPHMTSEWQPKKVPV